MRYLRHTFLLFAILAAGMSSRAVNKISDPGFESGVLSGVAYYNFNGKTIWRTWPHIAFSIDNTTGNSGARSLKMVYDENPNASKYEPTFRCEEHPSLEAGTYTFSFYYKTDQDCSSSVFKFRFVDGKVGETMTTLKEFSENPDAASANGFVKFETEFDLTSDVASFMPFVEVPFLKDGVTFHIDDVELEKVNKSPYAFEPNPINGATSVGTTSTLSWVEGVGAVSHSVYLGTEENNLTAVAQDITALSYDAKDLDWETQYFWRIDEKTEDGTISTGTVWSFTTMDYYSEMMHKFQTERVESKEEIVWEQFGPGNAGFVNFLRYHPLLPDVCLTSPDMNNTYQTEDNGTTWTTVKDVDGKSEFARLYDMYYSTKTAKYAIAIESSRLWFSTDTARSWTNVKHCPWYDLNSDGEDTRSWYRKVSAVALDPQDDDTWFVGAGNMSRGQQHLWSSMKDATAANPRGVESLYQGKIWKTADQGATWQELTNGIDPKAQFLRIIVHPTDQNLIWAASQMGLYHSKDGGNTWTNSTKGVLPNNTIMDMDYYYNQSTGQLVLYLIDQVRYAADGQTTKCSGGIFRSTDEGANWENITGDLTLDINRLTGGVSGNYYQYIAKWLGISTSEAQTTYPNLPTNALQYFNSLNVDPSRENALYVGFYDAQVQKSIIPGRLWQTYDGGQHWVNIARDFAPAWEADKAYWQERNNPYNDNVTMGHYPTNQQWGNNYPLRSMRYCAVNSRGNVMMLYAHNTLLSTDDGATFNQVDEDYTKNGNIMGHGNSNLPGECLYQDKRLGEDIAYFGSGEHHLWRSTNDGEDGRQALKWIEDSHESVFAIATHPWDEGTVYTTSMRQKDLNRIYRSTNGGESFDDWGKATEAEEWMRTNHIRIDPINPKYMYFGVTDISGSGGGSNQNGPDMNKEGGFYKSTNNGSSFTPSNTGMPDKVYVRDIKFDPRDDTRASLFVAAPYNPIEKVKGGLYFSSDRGANWTKIEVDPAVEGINSVVFDHADRIYVTTGRRSGNPNAGGVYYSDDYGTTWTKVFAGSFVENFDVSPFNRNLLVFSMGVIDRNPGIYFSDDRGATWQKNNHTLGQPDKISQVEFDLHDASTLWASVTGSGFSKGFLAKGDEYQRMKLTPGTEVMSTGETLQLSVETFGEVGTIQYKSMNNAVATVDENGVVTGKGQGAVKIWATSEDGTYSDYCYLVINHTTSAPTSSNNTIKVYPNPVEDELYLQGVKTGADITIYSSAGKMVYKAKYNKEAPIVVNKLIKGVYLFSVSQDGEVISDKFFKK